MGKFFGIEIKKTPVKLTNSIVQLPSGSFLKLGGQGYTLLTNLQADLTVSGLGGLEAGSVIPANGVMFLFVVRDGNTNYLTISSSNTSIYTSASFVGFVQINSDSFSSFIYDVYAYDTGFVSEAAFQFVPVLDQFNNLSEVYFQGRRVGDFFHVDGNFISSANGALIGLIRNFLDIQIDFDKVRSTLGTSSKIVGEYASSVTTNTNGGFLLVNEGTEFGVGFGHPVFGGDNTGNTLILQGANILPINTGTCSVRYSIPILGWSDNLQKLLG